MLSVLVSGSFSHLLSSSSTSPPQCTSDTASTAASEAAAATAAAAPSCAPPVAIRFVQDCTALEAGMRAITIAAQRGVPFRDDYFKFIMQHCLRTLKAGGRAWHCTWALAGLRLWCRSGGSCTVC